MTGLYAMASGTLLHEPIVKPTRTGGRFTASTLKIVNGAETVFVGIIAFADAVRAEFEGLDQGDAISVSGRLSTKEYTSKDGQPKISLQMVVDRALALKKRPRKPEKTRSAATPSASKAAPFDDGVGELFGGRQ